MGFQYSERWPQIIDFFDDKPRASAALNQRDLDLEHYLAGGIGGGELIFSYPAGLIATSSLEMSMPSGTTVTGAVGHLKTAGSTPTVVDIYYAGSVVGSLTFPAGQKYAETQFNVTTGARNTSVWSLTIATPGTGAVGLAVALTR